MHATPPSPVVSLILSRLFDRLNVLREMNDCFTFRIVVGVVFVGSSAVANNSKSSLPIQYVAPFSRAQFPGSGFELQSSKPADTWVCNWNDSGARFQGVAPLQLRLRIPVSRHCLVTQANVADSTESDSIFIQALAPLQASFRHLNPISWCTQPIRSFFSSSIPVYYNFFSISLIMAQIST